MRTRAIETSVDAYHAHRGSGLSSQQRGRILQHIKNSGGNWSIGEIAYALSMQKSTASARVNELIYETGDLEEKPRRKDRISGITIRPVGLPSVQMDLFQ